MHPLKSIELLPRGRAATLYVARSAQPSSTIFGVGPLSPFAEALRQLRFIRGLRQQDVAERVGCERSYLSALENDVKGAPDAKFVDALALTLGLSDEERDALQVARCEASRRCFLTS